jgi:replicative DNA helicase
MSTHSIETEQAVIGAVLMKNDLFGLISSRVGRDDFFEPVHGEIFEVCESLISMGKLASPLTIVPFLPAEMEITEGVNLRQYLARLAAAACTVSEAADLAAMVRDLAHRRAVSAVGNQLLTAKAPDPAELASWGIDELDKIAAARLGSSVPSLSLDQSVARAVDAAAQAYARDGMLSGLTTGLRDLDRKLLGLQRGELAILAGRPGSGKTAAALGMARAMASAGHKGIFYSLEMGDVALSQRMITDEAYDRAKVQYTKLRSGRFTEQDFTVIRDAALRLRGLPMRIEQQPKMTLAQLGSRARQEKRRRGLDFFVVDYLGLMEAPARYKGNRNLEIGDLTSGLRALAKELDCTALVLSQLSRGVEGREDKRPNMGDLRDSGNIEQDADVIIMVYREAYYLERKEPPIGSAEHELWQNAMERCFNKLQLIVEKQRMGPIGTVEVFCDIASNAVRNSDYEIEQRSTALHDQLAF